MMTSEENIDDRKALAELIERVGIRMTLVLLDRSINKRYSAASTERRKIIGPVKRHIAKALEKTYGNPQVKDT